MAGNQSAATAAASKRKADTKAETKAMLDERKRKRLEAESALGSEPVAAPKHGMGKGLMKGPGPSDASIPDAGTDAVPLVASEPQPRSRKRPRPEPSAAAPTASTSLVDVGGDTPPPESGGGASGGATSSRIKIRAPRGKRPPNFNLIFPPENWTRAERADLECIFTWFPAAPLVDDQVVERPYRPPYALDVEDSPHEDPSVCMKVWQNAFMPMDRQALAEKDFGVLSTEMFMHMKKASDMALEYRNRTERISNMEGGLQGFIDRADYCIHRVAELERELEGQKKSTSEMEARLKAEEEASASLKKTVSELEAAKEKLAKERRHYKDSALTAKEAQKASEAKVAALEGEVEAEKEGRKADVQRLEALVEKAYGMAEVSHEVGFDDCLERLSAVFPNHGLDLGLLSPADPNAPAAEEAADPKEGAD